MSIAANTQTRILATARELFHGRSYADVGIKEICDIAHVQKGSFYHFFRSKQDLAMAVIDAAYYWQKAAKDLEGRMPGCLFGNLALEVSTRDEVIRARLNAVFDKASARFREALDEAVENGQITPLDTQATASAMLAFLEGIILLAKTRNDPEVVLVLGPAIKTLRIEIQTGD